MQSFFYLINYFNVFFNIKLKKKQYIQNLKEFVKIKKSNSMSFHVKKNKKTTILNIYYLTLIIIIKKKFTR